MDTKKEGIAAKNKMLLGIDLGSVFCKAVLLDNEFTIVWKKEIRNRGNPESVFKSVLQQARSKFQEDKIKIGITGCGRESFLFPEEVYSCNEVISLAWTAGILYPQAKSLIEIGGTCSRWIRLGEPDEERKAGEILQFALNERCAAGSGAFLEQQAKRLKMNIREFAKLAESAGCGASIAGRCSVFAKSDMIHHQQKGTPVEEIAYGLCLALARNFISTLLKGQKCVFPVLYTGGGALNQGLIRAFNEILGCEVKQFILSENPFFSGAFGAAAGAEDNGGEFTSGQFSSFLKDLKLVEKKKTIFLPPLGDLTSRTAPELSYAGEEEIRGFLGVDVGSVSTNFAFIDEKGEVRAGIYLPTRGNPLEVIKEGFDLLFKQNRNKLLILGVGTTGSGRHLAGKILHADVIHNEITCQMVSTRNYFPGVETIFEIGGQDSKYISVSRGRIAEFTMNKICAAGTGSFLEEQAEHLDIDIIEDFYKLASRSRSPYDLGSRCTVFMDSELVNALKSGVSVEDATAGLAYSIVRNYLDKVVEGRPIGSSIVFQGGVASNPAVVRAFSLILNKPIQVHPYNRISGAIGAALIARDKASEKKDLEVKNQRLYQRAASDYQVSLFQCRKCANNCQVNRITVEGDVIYFGDVCERYTSGANAVKERPQTFNEKEKKGRFPDLFSVRNELAEKYMNNPESGGPRVGLPRASFMVDYLPFWTVFFNRLGCDVEVSPASNYDIFKKGLGSLPAETCLPVKMAFGHALWLEENDIDFLFFPSLIESGKSKEPSQKLCPYTEHLPFMLRPFLHKRKILTPCLDLRMNPQEFKVNISDLQHTLGKNQGEISVAYREASAAQDDFQAAMKRIGKKVLKQCFDQKKKVWLILGKPYNLHDSFINMNLDRHIKKIDVQALPIGFIPNEEDLQPWQIGVPPWKYNAQILKAAFWAKDKEDVFPLIISCYGCGPDAFTAKHLAKILVDKPHLFLEFDEHRAEAGLITRLEAFWDEIADYTIQDKRRIYKPVFIEEKTSVRSYREKKFVLPYFADHVFAFSGAMRGIGMKTEILPMPDEESVSLGEDASSGKECHAYSIIAGDLIKFAKSERKGGEIYYFPGTKNLCLLSQYGEGMNYLLQDLDIKDLEVLAPPFDFMTGLLGIDGLTLLWSGLVSIDLLIKASCEKRPYELEKGITDKIHRMNLADIEEGLAQRSLASALKRCARRLRSIPIYPEERPLIGIAGDIYTRQHPVANHNLFLKLEELGCEVMPAPLFVDEVDFSVGKKISKAVNNLDLPGGAGAGLIHLRKEWQRRKIRKQLKGAVKSVREPGYKDVIRFTSRYLHQDNNEILLLNIAKMADFAVKGASGVINAVCFNCMLGTVSEAIAARIQSDFNDIPVPTMIFSGTDVQVEKTKLEAFVFQVKNYHERHKKNRAFCRRSEAVIS
ncbi:MAG: hypothetical protein JW755_02115 [Candidatus Aminicenantes bacterium]|nr:hypothetical protein [Candidatus Aminicenantes bacterium]